MTALLVIAALQRSGTTALAQTLGQSATVENFGEVFHAVRTIEDGLDPAALMLRPEANFFRYKINRLREEPGLAYPSVANQTRLFEGFVAHLAGMSSKPVLLLDVKYNSWRHFDPVFHCPTAPPFLLHLLRSCDARFIHIRRSDQEARWRSERRAIRTGRWHRRVGEPAAADDETVAEDLAAMARARGRRSRCSTAGLPRRRDGSN